MEDLSTKDLLAEHPDVQEEVLDAFELLEAEISCERGEDQLLKFDVLERVRLKYLKVLQEKQAFFTNSFAWYEEIKVKNAEAVQKIEKQIALCMAEFPYNAAHVRGVWVEDEGQPKIPGAKGYVLVSVSVHHSVLGAVTGILLLRLQALLEELYPNRIGRSVDDWENLCVTVQMPRG